MEAAGAAADAQRPEPALGAAADGLPAEPSLTAATGGADSLEPESDPDDEDYEEPGALLPA